MECKLCNTGMKIGFAIEPRFHGNARGIMPFDQTMKVDEIKIMDCWKCPECGHSEDYKMFYLECRSHIEEHIPKLKETNNYVSTEYYITEIGEETQW